MMPDSEKLNEYIRKLARAYEMMQNRTGRPNKYIYPEDMNDGRVSIVFGIGLHPFGDIVALDNYNITVKSAFLIPFVKNKIYSFDKFEDFYRMVDIWYNHELSFIEGE
jgi:hypothetical protein